MNTYHIYQDYTGDFQAAVKIRNGKTSDRYINAEPISGRVKCHWTGYIINAATADEANIKYLEAISADKLDNGMNQEGSKTGAQRKKYFDKRQREQGKKEFRAWVTPDEARQLRECLAKSRNR